MGLGLFWFVGLVLGPVKHYFTRLGKCTLSMSSFRSQSWLLNRPCICPGMTWLVLCKLDDSDWFLKPVFARKKYYKTTSLWMTLKNLNHFSPVFMLIFFILSILTILFILMGTALSCHCIVAPPHRTHFRWVLSVIFCLFSSTQSGTTLCFCSCLDTWWTWVWFLVLWLTPIY